jgi:hypothetical protein
MNKLAKLAPSDTSDIIPDPVERVPRDNSVEITLQRETEAALKVREETRIAEIRESLVSKGETSEKPLAQLTVETVDIN